jgi:hypothetical protein
VRLFDIGDTLIKDGFAERIQCLEAVVSDLHELSCESHNVSYSAAMFLISDYLQALLYVYKNEKGLSK